MLGVGFEPTHPKILELESSALDRSAIQARGKVAAHGQTPRSPLKKRNDEKKIHIVWSIRVSIPVPRACKARTLPIELMPQHRVRFY